MSAKRRRPITDADRLAFQGMFVAERGDYDEAKRLFDLAITRGSSEGKYALALLYRFGHGVAPSEGVWLRLLREAADGGSSRAQYALARECHAADPETAFQWIHRAARRGHIAAQLDLAQRYYRGIASPRNYPQSLRWARRATFISGFNLMLLGQLGPRELRHELHRLLLLAKLQASRGYWSLRRVLVG